MIWELDLMISFSPIQPLTSVILWTCCHCSTLREWGRWAKQEYVCCIDYGLASSPSLPLGYCLQTGEERIKYPSVIFNGGSKFFLRSSRVWLHQSISSSASLMLLSLLTSSCSLSISPCICSWLSRYTCSHHAQPPATWERLKHSLQPATYIIASSCGRCVWVPTFILPDIRSMVFWVKTAILWLRWWKKKIIFICLGFCFVFFFVCLFFWFHSPDHTQRFSQAIAAVLKESWASVLLYVTKSEKVWFVFLFVMLLQGRNRKP